MAIEKRDLYDSIITEVDAGKTAAQIARDLRLSTGTVRAATKYFAQALAGVPFTDSQISYNKGLAYWAEARAKLLKKESAPNPAAPQTATTKYEDDATVFERYDKIYDLALSGVKHEDVAKRFGTSVRTVRRILNIRRRVESHADVPIDRHSRRILHWAQLRAGNSDQPAPTLTPAARESPLTLEKCTKPELIEIVRKIVSICGNAAEATLELELVRCECMRMLDTLAKLKEEVTP